MTSLDPTRRATSVEIQDDMLVVDLEDGRRVSVPLEWFPRLEAANTQARENWRLIGQGEGIHWPDVDEDVSVFSLLYPEKTIPSREIPESGAPSFSSSPPRS